MTSSLNRAGFANRQEWHLKKIRLWTTSVVDTFKCSKKAEPVLCVRCVAHGGNKSSSCTTLCLSWSVYGCYLIN